MAVELWFSICVLASLACFFAWGPLLWPIRVTLPGSGLRIDVLFEDFERGNHRSLGDAADSGFDYEGSGGVCSLLCCSDGIAAPDETFFCEMGGGQYEVECWECCCGLRW